MGVIGDAMRNLKHSLSGRAQAMAHPGVSASLDLDRVTALPRRAPPLYPIAARIGSAGINNVTPWPKERDLTETFARPGGTMSLLPAQNAMLWEAMQAGGLVGAVGVGQGKTLTSLLLPDILAAERPLLLIPASMREQLLADHWRYGQHFNLTGLLEPHQIEGVVWPSGVLVVASYEMLSSPRTASLLEDLRPDLIICDEAHALRYRASARTRRFLRYARQNPHVRYVFLSGTITSKSLRDYGHLAELALRDGSPLPRSWYELRDWADALDSIPNPIPPGALGATTEDARSWFRGRLTETPGVIISHSPLCDASLTIRALRPLLPQVLADILQHTRDTWSLGSDEFDTVVELTCALRQLSTGFYYEWEWPDNTPDEEWLELRRRWHGALRRFLLMNNRPGLDSPHLVQLAAMGGGVLADEWKDWARVMDRPAPQTVEVWKHDYLVRACVEWAAERLARKERGIVWYEHEAFGNALRAAGLRVFGAGAYSSQMLATCQEDVIACSIHAHGQGKNLQRWSWNLVTNPPASGQRWEQLIGRTHRTGQLEDEVHFDVMMQTPENETALQNAMADAHYIASTTGMQQRLLLATRVGF